MKRCPKLTNNQIQELQQIIKSSNYSSRETRRAQAILMLDAVTDYGAMAILTGYGRREAFKVRKRYLQQGIAGIEDKQKKNPKELLARSQREKLLKTIKEKTPNECDRCHNSDHWTTSAASGYVKRTYRSTPLRI